MNDYTEVVALPSKGKLNPDSPELAGGITLRMMTTEDEKIVFGSGVSYDALNKLLKNCIVSPKIDPSQLVSADREFLLIKLRILSYGPEYHTYGTCDECGKESEISFSLDDVIVHEIPDNFKEPIEVKLPLSKDVVGIRVLRGADLQKIDKRAKRVADKMNTNADEISYTMRLAAQIKTVNDEPFKSIADAEAYARKMYARDSATIRSKLNSIKLGYERRINCECPKCQAEMVAPFTMDSEFFRPRYDD